MTHDSHDSHDSYRYHFLGTSSISRRSVWAYKRYGRTFTATVLTWEIGNVTQLPNVKPNRLLGVGDAGVIRSFCQLQAMFAFSLALVASLTSPRPLERLERATKQIELRLDFEKHHRPMVDTLLVHQRVIFPRALCLRPESSSPLTHPFYRCPLVFPKI